MKKNIKGIGAVVATALLLVVTVVAVLSFQSFFHNYQSTTQANVEKNSKHGNSGIETLIGSSLYFKNTGDEQIEIQEVLVNGIKCNISSNEVISANKLDSIDIGDCNDLIEDPRVEVTVISNSSVYTKYVYYKDASGGSSSSIVGNTTVEFHTGRDCPVGYSNIYDYYSSSASHAAMPDQTDTNNSLCIKDDGFTVNADCSATSHQRLFYLGNVTNSHIWLDNSTAYVPYVGYYNWQEVCIGSTDGTVDIQYDTSDLSGSGYSQVASYTTSNMSLGATIGEKDVYSDKIWIKIS